MVLPTSNRHCLLNPAYVRLLKILCCHCCGLVFCLCSHCYCGHRYCSAECRTAAQRQAHREAQKRYRKTEKGKKAHREAEKRRRMGKSKIRKRSKNREVAVKCCESAVMYAKSVIETGAKLGEKTYCHFCRCLGVITDKFPRTYGGMCKKY